MSDNKSNDDISFTSINQNDSLSLDFPQTPQPQIITETFSFKGNFVEVETDDKHE